MKQFKDTIFIAICGVFFIVLGSVFAGNYLDRRQVKDDSFYKNELEKNYIFDHSQIKDTLKIK